MKALAEKRILKNKETKNSFLNLGDCGLVELPDELFECIWIKNLNLGSYYYNEPSKSLRKNNYRKKENQIKNLDGIESLKSLRYLTCDNNNILTIEPIQNLANLEILSLSGNSITNINHIAKLYNLKKLWFKNNNVSDISHLRYLIKLTELYFYKNKVFDISVLRSLNKLEWLDFSYNNVQDISVLEFIIEEIIYINCHNNPALALLPPRYNDEFYFSTDAFYYWLDNYSKQKLSESNYIREAKVVFVGDGKVGKTSLKYLLLQNERIDAERTQEIEIHTDTEKFTYQSEPLTLHFWDFGGQEIMHATHKFFMTERSVYLLVVSGREEKEESLEKWLEMLRSTCGDSPILLVVNQLDNPEDTHRLPLQRLLADYPQIRGVVETSWKTGRGMAALHTKIQEILEMLPHFEEPFAPKYAKVKTRLLDLNENYINYREYAKICAEVGQELEEDFNSGSQSVLADVLNYLGIMLNFRQKSDELEDLFIFNPKWIIRGVYKIINSEAVQKSGKISELEVNQLLKNTDYQTQQERDFILRMMLHFELAYKKMQFGEADYLIPSVFNPDKPQELGDYWTKKKQEKTDILRFRFQYKTWRNDYISYFLVNQNEKIKAKFFWKDGAILQYRENEVFIEANRFQKNIEIQVIGNQDKRYALWQVREALEGVHQKFIKENLGISEMVIYEENGIEDFFKVKRLQAMQKNGIKEEYSEKLDKMISIEKLLNGVELTEKEKFRSSLQNKKLSESQIDSLVNLVEGQYISECYETLEKYGIFTQESNRLRKEFILGIHKTDVDYWDRMITFVKSL